MEGPKGEAMVRTGIPLAAACPVGRLINICGRRNMHFYALLFATPKVSVECVQQKLWFGDGKIQRGDKLQMRDANQVPARALPTAAKLKRPFSPRNV